MGACSRGLPRAALCLAALLAGCPALAAVTPFSSSIVLAVPSDYLPDGSGRSKCQEMVARAKQDNVRQLQFVPTLFWVDEGPLDPPPGFDPSCRGSDLDSYYCYNRFNATRIKWFCYDRDNCKAAPQQWEIDRFRDALAACMKVAVADGFDLAVNMHVDDATGGGMGGWRNTLNFSPLEQYGGRSYVDVVLNPIADAIKAAASPSTQVDLIMQGEMGATIFFHPLEWLQLARDLKQRIAGQQGPIPQSNIRVGVGINNAKLCGCILVPIIDHREFLDKFPPEFYKVKSEFNMPAIQSLFDGIDFVGISAYIPMPRVEFDVCDMEGLLRDLDEEMSYYNLSIDGLVSKGKGIHYIEFGVGGGTSANGDQKATTAEQAAFTPFFGMAGPYTRAKDPFVLYDLSQPSPVRDYSRRFYNATAQYLARGGCNYTGAVTALYVWNLPSWDVQAIYPISTTSEGSYRDPAIVDIINLHNKEALGF